MDCFRVSDAASDLAFATGVGAGGNACPGGVPTGARSVSDGCAKQASRAGRSGGQSISCRESRRPIG
jgi:hypothetical protein